MNDITLFKGDCLDVMKSIHNIDCIITSPPYNVGLNYNSYKDDKEYDNYLLFMRKVFEKCFMVLNEDGRICINIGDAKNGSIPTHSDFIQILSEIGFIPITTIIWNKNNTSNRCAWGSYLSAKAPSFPRGFEYILIFGKSKTKKSKGVSTISKEEWKEYSNGLWIFAPETKQKQIGHPAMFPVELPKRLIKMLTYENDIILDPFMGSGTTGIACMETNRNFIGIEIDEKYYNIAKDRLSLK